MRSIILAAAVGVLSASSVMADATVYALGTDNILRVFQASTPGTIAATIPVTGLAQGESLVGIDTRALNGELVGLGSGSSLYKIDKVTGAATVIGTPGTLALSGAEAGIDFNPTVDRIRYVDAGAGNRRFNPVTGGLAANDTALTYTNNQAAPRAVGVAYTNSKLGGVPAGSVREYIIDSNLDALGEVGSMAGGNASFNAGVSVVVGSLGFDTNDLVGFDIDGNTGIAYLSLTDPTSNLSSFYTLNLATGSATLVGAIDGSIRGATIRDITVVPEPTALAGVALAGLFGLRRRK
jgi:hypothetical protein